MKGSEAFKRWGAGWINNWFFRLLFSYLPLFLIVLALVFTSFLQSYSERNQKELKTVSGYINESIMQTVDNQLKAVYRQINTEMTANYPIMEFFKMASIRNPLMDYQALMRLQQIKSATPLIDSLYAVRFSDNTVIGVDNISSISSVDTYPDKAFIEQQRRQPYVSGWLSMRRIRESDGSAQQVVTLIRKGYPGTRDAGMIVVNLSVPQLEDAIKEVSNANYPYVRITDKSGQTIIGAEGNSRNPAIAVSVSPYVGWTYRIQWFERKAPFIYNTVPKLWITVMILASLFGILGVIYATYRNYRPVRAITSMIEDFTRKQAVRIADEHANEMKYIENVIDTLIDRSLKNREVVELHYFRDLLDGEKRTIEGWGSDHNRLKRISPDSRFTVLVMEIDHHHEFVQNYSERDQKLLKYVLKSMVQEMLQGHGLANWAEWMDNRRMACIIAHTAELDASNSLYGNIVDWVHANLRFTVTIGVGRDVVHAGDLGASRATALRALRYKAAHGIGRVIDAAEVADAAPVPISHYYALCGSVLAAYRVSLGKGRDKLRELVKAMRKDRIDREVLKRIAEDFIIRIDEELSGMSEDYQQAWPAIRDGYALEEVETIDEFEGRLEGMANALYSHLGHVREARNHRVQLEEIRSFVTRNFADPAMSLDLLGDRFELNPKYISKLFKDEFGINFVEFVLDLRIEHACKLLTESDDPIQEIAERSGYANSISFGRMFKNKTGMTPGEYRQRKRV